MRLAEQNKIFKETMAEVNVKPEIIFHKKAWIEIVDARAKLAQALKKKGWPVSLIARHMHRHMGSIQYYLQDRTYRRSV